MRLWSVTTTVRNPERIRSFLKVLKEMEGETWNTELQKKFQIKLIQHKVYGFNEPQFEKTLSHQQLEWLHSDTFKYEQAEEILNAKNYEGGGEMRGRQSFNPLEKMGLAYINDDKKIIITSFGKTFLSEDYDLGNIFFRSFLKWQYPNPDLNKYPSDEGYNIKPLIATFHLINKVNTFFGDKGVSKTEFAMFFTTLSNYKNIEATAKKLIAFRSEYKKRKTKLERDTYVIDYFNKHYSEYGSWKNAIEYTDNIIRYFRLTRFFYLHGNDNYINLEKRRKVEIDSLIETDDASAKTFVSKAEYSNYLGDSTSPELPWETEVKLQEVIVLLLADIEIIERDLIEKNISFPERPDIIYESDNINSLKKMIENLRLYRRTLNDIAIHEELQSLGNIEICINSLRDIFKIADKKPVELERIITRGLHILNDALEIRPNYPVGDDNYPTFAAPANKPDIECFYKTFNLICEVTLLRNRSQWFNEGQPVMRHLRDFEEAHSEKKSYCLFVAPNIHRDTVNTFWNSVKHKYEKAKQRIIPITIKQFIYILQCLLEAKKHNEDYFLSHIKIKELFDDIVLAAKKLSDSTDWLTTISGIIEEWGKSVTI